MQNNNERKDVENWANTVCEEYFREPENEGYTTENVKTGKNLLRILKENYKETRIAKIDNAIEEFFRVMETTAANVENIMDRLEKLKNELVMLGIKRDFDLFFTRYMMKTFKKGRILKDAEEIMVTQLLKENEKEPEVYAKVKSKVKN